VNQRRCRICRDVLNFFQPSVDNMLRGKMTRRRYAIRQTRRANYFLRMMGRTRAELAKNQGI